MKFYVLASLITFCLVIARAIRRNTRLQQQAAQSFWAKERQANNVRRKPLEHLDYIHIPFDQLPVEALTEDKTVAECLDILHTLDSMKIVNFTGYTNTDLKLEYGTANITALMEYDQNYTLLVRTLQQWAGILYQAGKNAEARKVLEFSISTHSDISKTYYMLAELYALEGETQQIDYLIETAQELRSASKKAIVRKLQESYPCNG